MIGHPWSYAVLGRGEGRRRFSLLDRNAVSGAYSEIELAMGTFNMYSVKRLGWTIPALFFLLPGGCGQKQQPAGALRTMAVPVSAAAAVAKDVPVEVLGIGNGEAYSTVAIKSQVTGELTAVHFTEGQDVRKGELLFSIDPRLFRNDLERVQANLARDTAQLKQAEANLARDIATAQNAELEKNRYKQLVQKGVTAPEVYDRLNTTYDATQASVRAGRAAIDSLAQAIKGDQAAIDNAKLQLEYCSIRSPIDGRTGSLAVHAGNLVKANDTPALVTINQITPIYVNFSVPEQELQEIRRRMAQGRVPVKATIPGEEGRPIEGWLTFIENEVDSSTGTIRMKGTFQNSDRRIWPGQFANVVITLGVERNAIVVPSQALQTGQSGPFVFVIKPDQTVDARPVTPGRSLSGVTVIDKGLQAGETVVTDGQNALVPGAKAVIKPTVEPRQDQRS